MIESRLAPLHTWLVEPARAQRELVKIVRVLRPVLNYKGV